MNAATSPKVGDSLLLLLCKGSRHVTCKTSWPNDTQDEGDARSIPEFRLLREWMPMNMLRQAFTCIHFWLTCFGSSHLWIKNHSMHNCDQVPTWFMNSIIGSLPPCIPKKGASVSSVPMVRLGTSHAKPPWYKALARGTKRPQDFCYESPSIWYLVCFKIVGTTTIDLPILKYKTWSILWSRYYGILIF